MAMYFKSVHMGKCVDFSGGLYDDSGLCSDQPHDGSTDMTTDLKHHMGQAEQLETSNPTVEQETHRIPLPAIMVNNISKHDLEGDIEKDAGVAGVDMAKGVSETLEVPSDDLKKHDVKLEGLQLLSSSSGTKVSVIPYCPTCCRLLSFVCQKLWAVVVFTALYPKKRYPYNTCEGSVMKSCI